MSVRNPFKVELSCWTIFTKRKESIKFVSSALRVLEESYTLYLASFSCVCASVLHPKDHTNPRSESNHLMLELSLAYCLYIGKR